MAEVKNISRLLRKLEELERAAKTKHTGTVAVGYAANYALHVHENLEAHHKPGKQAKYLEAPARTLSKELADIVMRAATRKVPLRKALLLAGLRLQRESQQLVPVDTGNLRGSAYTVEE